jgi:hypothetical protein
MHCLLSVHDEQTSARKHVAAIKHNKLNTNNVCCWSYYNDYTAIFSHVISCLYYWLSVFYLLYEALTVMIICQLTTFTCCFDTIKAALKAHGQ